MRGPPCQDQLILKKARLTALSFPPTEEQIQACDVQPYLGLTIAAMARLVLYMKLPESRLLAAADPEWTGFRNTKCTSEDLHRAFHVLKFVERQRTKADNKNFLKTTTNQAVIEAKYLTPELVERAQHGHQAPTEKTDAADKLVESLHDLANDEAAPGDLPGNDPRFQTQMDADWSKIVEQSQVLEGRADRHQHVGFSLNRDPMTAGQQRALCKHLGSKVKVKYQDMNMGMQHKADEVSLLSCQDQLIPGPRRG